MKKILLTIVTLFAILGFSATSFAYTLTSKDNTLITALTQKIEQVISDRGEKTREPLVKAIQDLAKKYSKQPRVETILNKVADNIDTSFVNDLENILDGVGENLDYKVEQVGYIKILYLLKNGKKIKVDEVEGEFINIKFIEQFFTYDFVSTGGSVKKVFDIHKENRLYSIYYGKFTSDNKYIYACNGGGYGPGYIGVIDIKNNKEYKYTFDIENSFIASCSYSQKDGNHFINFTEGGVN